MQSILRHVENARQRVVDTYSDTCLPSGMEKRDSRGHRKPEPQPEDERRGLGRRLAAARVLAGLTLDAAAKALNDRGYTITRAAIGAWETGRNLPDALWLRRIAKLYGTTLDALVWDEAISMEGIQFAVQFDALSPANQRKFRAMWLAYFEEAKTDAEVEEAMPATKTKPASTADEVLKLARPKDVSVQKSHKRAA